MTNPNDQITLDRHQLETLVTAAEYGARKMDDKTVRLMEAGEYHDHTGDIFDATHASKTINSIQRKHDLEPKPSEQHKPD